MRKTDIVYVLGKGSNWNDNEIRFSLRSIEKNLKNFGNIYIVGEKPDFLQNIIHVQCEDIFEPGTNADGNIITKVLAACKLENLSQIFLFINDDHLILKPTETSQIPPIHKGDMTTFDNQYWKLNFWRKRLHRTMEILKSKGFSTLHFDCHVPIIFDKVKFPAVMSHFNYKKDIGFTMKSLYANWDSKKPVLLDGQKEIIFNHLKHSEISHKLRNAQFMSFNDLGLNNSLKWWLIKNFPNKSRFEKNTPHNRIFDLFYWDKNGQKYSEGVKIITTYFKNTNLTDLFQNNKSDILIKKLTYKLTSQIKQL